MLDPQSPFWVFLRRQKLAKWGKEYLRRTDAGHVFVLFLLFPLFLFSPNFLSSVSTVTCIQGDGIRAGGVLDVQSPVVSFHLHLHLHFHLYHIHSHPRIHLKKKPNDLINDPESPNVAEKARTHTHIEREREAEREGGREREEPREGGDRAQKAYLEAGVQRYMATDIPSSGLCSIPTSSVVGDVWESGRRVIAGRRTPVIRNIHDLRIDNR